MFKLADLAQITKDGMGIASIPNLFETLANIEAQLFIHDAWAASTIHYWLNLHGNQGLVLLDEQNQVVAYCLYSALFEQAEIIRIGVRPQAHRQGLASQLLGEVYRHLGAAVERLLLEVRVDNPAAIALYQKQGFHSIHTRKGYYRNQDGTLTDALMMQKILIH